MTTWTAPERSEPSETAGERTLLEGFLDWHRDTLQRKCAGLTPEQLCERPIPPSTMSLLGMVRHLTEVERWWFMNGWVPGIEDIYCTPGNMDGDWDDTDPARADQDRDTYLQAITAARATAAQHGLDDVVEKIRSDGRPPQQVSLRWIYLHMIEEYARHNGHADLLREKLDGATGE